MECYVNSENWQKNLANCFNLPNSPKFLLAMFFTVWYAHICTQMLLHCTDTYECHTYVNYVQ